ncbi:UDP-N-acetylmuramate dehydrogenase [Arthrobacter rhombi]|uniref:UDP-N-acetylmuramate dehydrogenase n=1 Tax=Arthrobacter rhombi TaxID=71253 RepID=UPI003FD46AC6
MMGPLLSTLTTNGVGGPAGTYLQARTEQELITAVREADEAGHRLLLVGGGSNLVISDDGYPGTVLRVATRGVDIASAPGGTRVTVQAGHPWDDVVQRTLDAGLVGLEALSGIPGSAGATPVQNVGAYGTDVSKTLESVRAWDRQEARLVVFGAADLDFGYRNSLLKATTVEGSPRYVVLDVSFVLETSAWGAPIAYAELARTLGVQAGERAKSTAVRETVLGLRAGKGMVLDPSDRDTYSSGSFFTNPIVDAETAASLPEDAPRFPAEGGTKLSAAWLIDRAGFAKGFGLPGTPGASLAGGRASLSTKHTLAITNRGEATAQDLLAIARAVRDGVSERFGVTLHNESLLIGIEL